MTNFILLIYDRFRKSRILALVLFLTVTACLMACLLTLSYKEDISDFLPLDEDNQIALSVYQDVSGANRIYAVISSSNGQQADPDTLVAGVDAFVDNIILLDSLDFLSGITKIVDMESLTSVMDEVYDNIPYFLTDEDYTRIDSLLSMPGYVESQLIEDKQFLMFPTSGMSVQNISRDPLNLFTPVFGRLQQGGLPIRFETHNGYILTPDCQHAIVSLESSFGAHESDNNAKLVEMLNTAAANVESDNANIDIHLIGGPVIAVSNARQIKKDSVMAVCIAGILILALLIYVFRNVWNILLIVVSVGWGWLFAMGGIALYYDSVSIIVIGISSIILGIAVNYPLHLIDHMKDSPRPRAALKEIISPLIIGNVTTVGAFLCLVPLSAPALHDLGLFSSLLLVGTILFVLVFLPQAVRIKKMRAPAHAPVLIHKIAGISLESNRFVVWTIILLTGIFGYFSLKTEFDSDMRNINYMTDEQKSDMNYFQSLFNKEKNTESVYVVSHGNSWDDALKQNELIGREIDSLEFMGKAVRHNAVSSFLLSKESQQMRIDKWSVLLDKHREILTDSLEYAAVANGFNKGAFIQFNDIISAGYVPKEFSEFENLVSTVFIGNVSKDETAKRFSVVQTIEVPKGQVDAVKRQLATNQQYGGYVFDVKSMNGSISDTLSGDFNYIGIACGCIVFLFLWLSFGRIELAIVSFLPMAISWIWILGIMGILGIRFNIVNVILATFIFGQGDDYIIFMTEGLTHEFAYRKKLLVSYKNSIIVSAIIMFIGIGTLVFAKHPALRSLGEVTVVGMLSVVLMAYLFPPLIFNWLVRKNGKVRWRPITLKKILCTGFCVLVFFAQLASAYILGFFLFVISRPTSRKRLWFHKYVCSVFRFDIKRMPGIHSVFENKYSEKFNSPAVIICNHQSILDSFCMMSLSPKIILLANEHIRVNPIIRLLFKWSDFMSVSSGASDIVTNLRTFVDEGYSVVLFPEGTRPEPGDGKVMRFHKGAFHIAHELALDIVPVYIDGLVEIMPKGSALSNGGTMFIGVGKRILNSELNAIGDTAMQAKTFRTHYSDNLAEIRKRVLTVDEVRPIVMDRYLYKGRDIELRASRMLKHFQKYSYELSSADSSAPVYVYDRIGQGELGLLLAIMYPSAEIYCSLPSDESRTVFEGCVQDFITNIHIMENNKSVQTSSGSVFEVSSTGELLRLK